jgi:hypothetical protein
MGQVSTSVREKGGTECLTDAPIQWSAGRLETGASVQARILQRPPVAVVVVVAVLRMADWMRMAGSSRAEYALSNERDAVIFPRHPPSFGYRIGVSLTTATRQPFFVCLAQFSNANCRAIA